VKAINDPAFGSTGKRLEECVAALEQSTSFLLKELSSNVENALAGATPYARIFGLATGGVALAKLALAARKAKGAGSTAAVHDERIALARFFAENFAVGAPGLAVTVIESGPSVAALSA
jgi:acyl-CoA dehydrogenase